MQNYANTGYPRMRRGIKCERRNGGKGKDINREDHRFLAPLIDCTPHVEKSIAWIYGANNACFSLECLFQYSTESTRDCCQYISATLGSALAWPSEFASWNGR